MQLTAVRNFGYTAKPMDSDRAARPQMPLDLVVLYAPEDAAQFEAFEKHLAVMRNVGLVRDLHKGSIRAGEDWKRVQAQQLDRADIVAFLVSASFLHSDECNADMAKALDRRKRGHAEVVPIIVRECDWEESATATLKPLPTNKRAVASWSNQDEAWKDVAVNLRTIVEHQVSLKRHKGTIELLQKAAPDVVRRAQIEEAPIAAQRATAQKSVATKIIRHAVLVDEQMLRRLWSFVSHGDGSLTIRCADSLDYESRDIESAVALFKERRGSISKLIFCQWDAVGLCFAVRIEINAGFWSDFHVSVTSRVSVNEAEATLEEIERCVRQFEPSHGPSRWFYRVDYRWHTYIVSLPPAAAFQVYAIRHELSPLPWVLASVLMVVPVLAVAVVVRLLLPPVRFSTKGSGAPSDTARTS